MSASRGRRRRQRAAALAKARRQRAFAIVGAIVLGVLLFIQVPKVLKGDETPTTAAPATPVTTAPTTTPAPEPSKTAKALKSLAEGPASDPFKTRAISAREPSPLAANGYPGRDPFAAPNAQSVARPTAPEVPGRIVVGTPRAGKAPTIGYIVVIASVPVRDGRRTAEAIAGRARKTGIAGVGILQSSKSRSLRAGYFAVYVGSYKFQSVALNEAAGIRARGFRDAYIRELVRY